MKKHLLVCLFAAMTFGSVVTSCSDDDPIVNPVPESNTYVEESGLTLNYNGNALLGKKVLYTPSTTDATKATLTLQGEDFDLLGSMLRADGIAFNTPGVFPGSSVTELDVNLIAQGDMCLFEGESETDFCTFSYKGDVSKSNLNLDLTNVKLKEAGLAGQWELDSLITDHAETKQTPLYFEWNSKELVKIELFPGFEMKMPIRDVIVLALSMPLIDNGSGDKIVPFDMLSASFKDVRFGEDGNVTAKIVDFANGQTQPSVSPENIAFYVVDKMPVVSERGMMRLFLNLETINKIANSNAAKSRAEGFDIVKLLAFVNPYIQNGIPLALEVEADGKLRIMLDTKFLLPILKDILGPLLENEALLQTLLEMLKSNPDLSAFAPTAEAMIKQLPEIIKTTDSIEIGLNFTLNK